MQGDVGIWVKLYPPVLSFHYLVTSTRSQLTLDFRSMHPKTCFGGGSVPLGSVCPGVKFSFLLPSKKIFNGLANAIIFHGS